MPRRRESRPSPSARSAPKRPMATMSRPAAAPVPAPAPAAAVPAPVAPQQPGLFAQMASTAAGVAVGSAVGHTMGHAVTGLFSGGGSSSREQAPEPAYSAPATAQPTAASSACDADNRAFLRCLEQNNNDIGSCQIYYDLFKQCMQSNSQALV